MKDVDADYYGYMDDDDGILIPLEEAEEAKAIARTVDEWRAKKEAGISEPVERRAVEDLDPDIYHVEEGSDDEDGGTVAGTRVELDEQGQPKYIAHVPVPSQQEIEEALLRRKKMEMLEKYANETLTQQSHEAKTLMGFGTKEKKAEGEMEAS